ncbi:MAG: putative toxin-antitoxin system toxin component, PIN family [Anaerolineae bacterium]|nr:putative toxin-antitoxin system toxin component, PIN family [Anaerolineae bacterium]
MTERLRAVLDTNVFVSAFLSRSPTSPTQELIQRWEAHEFTLLVSDGLVDELAEKLIERGISQERVIEFLALLGRLAEWVDVPDEAVKPVIEADPDDDIILACAVVGDADYLVTYDPHFDVLGGEYEGVRITRALPFLKAVREGKPLGE